MSTTSSTNTPDTASAADQINSALTNADAAANQAVQTLTRVHQARLARSTRTVAVLTARLGPSDPRVAAVQASVAATTTTIARISMVHQQMTAPVVQVAQGGWALQGRVVDAQLKPAARFTVFLVNENKTFLKQYGFAYTDDTGYFLINHPGSNQANANTVAGVAGVEAGAAAPPVQLFIEIANTDGNPVYLSTTAFQPVTGAASYQNIVLPAGTQPIGDPPREIRVEALPHGETKNE